MVFNGDCTVFCITNSLETELCCHVTKKKTKQEEDYQVCSEISLLDPYFNSSNAMGKEGKEYTPLGVILKGKGSGSS